MQLHERTLIVREASAELSEAFARIVKTRGLTWGEVTQILSERISTYALYQIREERHGDTEKKGDEA